MPVTVNDVQAPSSQQTDAARRARVREGADRCPGVLRPHGAADGLLVRVRLIGGRVDAAGWSALAAGARLGNGIVELTGRGNVQVRGLAADALEHLAALLHGAGLLRSAAHDRARNIACEPLAGRRCGAVADEAAVDAVLDALDGGLCVDDAFAALPGRFLFCVDDGGGAVGAPEADVRLVASGAGTWSVLVGDEVAVLDAGVPERAVQVALEAARAFLDVRGDSGAWRVAELPGGAGALLAAVLGHPPAANVRPCAPWRGTTDVRQGAGERWPLVGVLGQRDGRAAVGALAPLGRIAPTALDLLGDVARHAEVRVSGARTVTVLDVEPADAPELVRALTAAGLVVVPGSGWEGLTACAGAGACASALADVRAAAGARAAVRSAGAPREHWSACPRRCGETADVARAVCARADGTWDVTEIAR